MASTNKRSVSNNSVNGIEPGLRAPSLFKALASKVGSFFSPPKEAKPLTFTEITPYGFVSRNYLKFLGGNLSGADIKAMDDGSRVIRFAHGGAIIETSQGHMTEVDAQGRVVTLRYPSERAFVTSDPETAARLGFRTTKNAANKTVICCPGGVSVIQDETTSTIVMPNGLTAVVAIYPRP